MISKARVGRAGHLLQSRVCNGVFVDRSHSIPPVGPSGFVSIQHACGANNQGSETVVS